MLVDGELKENHPLSEIEGHPPQHLPFAIQQNNTLGQVLGRRFDHVWIVYAEEQGDGARVRGGSLIEVGKLEFFICVMGSVGLEFLNHNSSALNHLDRFIHLILITIG